MQGSKFWKYCAWRETLEQRVSVDSQGHLVQTTGSPTGVGTVSAGVSSEAKPLEKSLPQNLVKSESRNRVLSTSDRQR